MKDAIDGKTENEAGAIKTSDLSPRERESLRLTSLPGVANGYQIDS